tara:strand:- start:276 stop:515 length:240 start_codon:yes stop_codon:yes gene_type:complete
MKKIITILTIVFMCSTLDANIDYRHKYEYAYKQKQRKSVGKIIKDIINRKKDQRKKDIDNTFPIPFYDSINPDGLKDIA